MHTKPLEMGATIFGAIVAAGFLLNAVLFQAIFIADRWHSTGEWKYFPADTPVLDFTINFTLPYAVLGLYSLLRFPSAKEFSTEMRKAVSGFILLSALIWTPLAPWIARPLPYDWVQGPFFFIFFVVILTLPAIVCGRLLERPVTALSTWLFGTNRYQQPHLLPTYAMMLVINSIVMIAFLFGMMALLTYLTFGPKMAP